MVTIKDIANKAKVSPATVSRVLNNDDQLSVADDTRENIFAIAEKLGYVKHKRKNVPKKQIAVVQWYSQQEELNDLYYYAIRIGLEKRAQELGFEVARYFNQEIAALSGNIDGIIAIGKFSPSQIEHLSSLTEHLIFIDSNTLREGYSCITTDFEHAVMDVVDHFVDQGQTKIGMIVGEERTKDGELILIDPRFRTFKNYMLEVGLYRSAYVYVGDFSTQSGYQMMKQAIEDLGDNLPQAFFIASDSLAIGALRALQEAKIAVPERVSLIGFNDTPITKQVFPTLSSITVYTEEMGRVAVDCLNREFNEPNPSRARMIKLSTELTLRDSSLNGDK